MLLLQPRECLTEGIKCDERTHMCSITESSHLRLKFFLLILTLVRTKLNIMKKYKKKIKSRKLVL
jgi:hypothetical protein